ncbi:MAG: ABC transporter permease [Muribaculaceae bacterium]|nr:ABC transporter permease [Muribaculaceae bacterium]MBQ4006589.1 ABC transporter permease [Muribaculaceae bacterium]
MKYISQIFDIALRELNIFRQHSIYGFCMLVFPVLLVVFFTTMLDEGTPQDLPIGVVDEDNSAMSRTLVRNLDAMQNSHVAYRFASPTEARCAMQEGKVYGFLYIPDGTASKLLAGRQPKVSFYYTMTCMTAGSMASKDLKTIGMMGSAAVGQATLSAKGATPEQIKAALQPVTIDAHMIANPQGSYNYSLTTVFVPGILMLFMALLSAYAVGMEMKFDTGKEWLARADNNIVVATLGKFLVHALVFFLVIFGYQYYIFNVLHFPHLGGVWSIVRLTVLQVLASLGFGVFAFGLMPSMRMSMSISSLWSVLSISMCGSAFPVAGMDPPLQSMSWLFPLRHYWMIYQATVLNGFPVIDVWFHLVALVAFTLLPWFVLGRVKNAMLNYVYIP